MLLSVSILIFFVKENSPSPRSSLTAPLSVPPYNYDEMEARYQRFINESGVSEDFQYESDEITEYSSLGHGESSSELDEWIEISKRMDGSYESEPETAKTEKVKKPTIKKPLLFTCDTCKKDFSGKSSLEKHLRIHRASFICNVPECKKVFPSHGYLTRHMANHEGNKAI